MTTKTDSLPLLILEAVTSWFTHNFDSTQSLAKALGNPTSLK